MPMQYLMYARDNRFQTWLKALDTLVIKIRAIKEAVSKDRGQDMEEDAPRPRPSCLLLVSDPGARLTKQNPEAVRCFPGGSSFGECFLWKMVITTNLCRNRRNEYFTDQCTATLPVSYGWQQQRWTSLPWQRLPV